MPLLARFTVIPCETYHIRLVVGDVGDDKLDSAVFLKSKSFNLGELAKVKAVIPNQRDTVAYENCLDGQFVFTRPSGSLDFRPLEVDFEIDESSTALEGIDFSSLPRSITIPPGQDSVILPISTLLDEETEDIESLTVNLRFFEICECVNGSSATLNFADPEPPIIGLPTLVVCADQPFTLVPQISSGVPPYNLHWSDNSTGLNLQTNVQVPTNFVATVTDLCNNQATDTVQINLQSMPTATLSGNIDYCEGLQNPLLPISFNGNPPWSFTYQINNNSPVTIDSIFDANFNLPITEAGNYQLIEFKDATCNGEVSGTGQVNDINIKADIEVVAPLCPDVDDGQISLNILAASPPFDINWSPSVNNATNPTNLSAGIYALSIQDEQNCLFMDSIVIEDPNGLAQECINNAVYIPNAFSPNGDGINDFFEIFLAEQTTIRQVLKVEITDRWGNLVYFSEDGMPRWNGNYRGQLLNPAVFLYTIQIELHNGKTEILQGSLNLVE